MTVHDREINSEQDEALLQRTSLFCEGAPQIKPAPTRGAPSSPLLIRQLSPAAAQAQPANYRSSPVRNFPRTSAKRDLGFVAHSIEPHSSSELLPTNITSTLTMKLFLFGKKQSKEEKAAAQALKAQQKEEKARLAALHKAHKAHEAQARKTAKEEKKRAAREEKEWKKQEKQLREREKQEQKRIEKREKQERKRIKKLEKQHATARRREERRRRKELMRNRRKMKKLRKLQKKQRRAQDPAVHQRQIDVLLAATSTASEQSPLSSQDPIVVAAASSAPAVTPPAFKKRANCFTCRSKFRVNRLRHHCRNCGESCCRKCLSEVKRPIPWQEGKPKPQKVCLLCDALVFSDRMTASLATASAVAGAASASAVQCVPSRSNSMPEVESPPASASSSGSQRPASGSGISVSLSSSRSSHRRLRRNDSSSGSATMTKKPSLWTLPIRPLLKRKRSVEQLRNRQADFELQLEKAAQLSRAHQKTLAIELQPQHSTLAAPLARVS